MELKWSKQYLDVIHNISNKLNLLPSSSEMPSSTSPNPCIIAKGDSGATSNFICQEDQKCLQNVRPHQGPSVILPDQDTITPTHTGTLALSNQLSSAAKMATVLPGLKTSSLISMGQLCDDDCNILLTKKHLFAVKNNHVVLTGRRNHHDGLWDIHLPTSHF